MILTPKNKEALGEFADKVSRSTNELAKLLADPNGVLNDLFEEDLKAPGMAQIVVHVTTPGIMHLVIPMSIDIDNAHASDYQYPAEYDPASATHIDPQENDHEKHRAIMFRVGDYTLNTCM